MKLTINTPSRNWEEAATIARAQESQGLLTVGKENAIRVIEKHTYSVWKTKTAVNIELAE